MTHHNHVKLQGSASSAGPSKLGTAFSFRMVSELCRCLEEPFWCLEESFLCLEESLWRPEETFGYLEEPFGWQEWPYFHQKWFWRYQESVLETRFGSHTRISTYLHVFIRSEGRSHGVGGSSLSAKGGSRGFRGFRGFPYVPWVPWVPVGSRTFPGS